MHDAIVRAVPREQSRTKAAYTIIRANRGRKTDYYNFRINVRSLRLKALHLYFGIFGVFLSLLNLWQENQEVIH